MASKTSTLDVAAAERKARLARLASLKRKQHPTDDEPKLSHTETPLNGPVIDDASGSSINVNLDKSNPVSILSGRNYDLVSREPKLGFDSAPDAQVETLEDRAAILAEAVNEVNKEGSTEEKPLDLFTLQPKKPNWDLKRDLMAKTEILDQRTDNAIARLVRRRLEGAKTTNDKVNGTLNGADQDNIGLAGSNLVEGMKVRERENEEDIERERAGDTSHARQS